MARKATIGSRRKTQTRIRAGGLMMALALSCPASASLFTWEVAPVTNNWESAINWAGPIGGVPDDFGDEAVVDGPNDTDPMLTQDRLIGSLSILNAADVHTGDGINNFQLNVSDSGPHNGRILVDGAGSQLVVRDHFGFDVIADIVHTENNGRITMMDESELYATSLLHNNGDIRGAGLVQLGGNQVANNNGRIIAAGGPMIVQRDVAEELDYDGDSGDGNLEAFFDSKLTMDVPPTDEFNGFMFLENNSEIQINYPWTLGATGGARLVFNTSTQPSRLSGALATLNGQVEIGEGGAIFNAQTAFGPTADVEIDPDATIIFNSPSTVANADSFQAPAAFTLIVNDNVSIGTGAGAFNWDGNANSMTQVNAGANLSINAATVDLLNDEMDGTIELNGGRVNVNVANNQWTMDGQLDMHDGAEVDGDQMLLTGTMNVTGNGNLIDASSIFASTSAVNVTGNLDLGGGSTTLNGGDWTGNGAVRNETDLTVSSATTINMPNGSFDLDGGIIGNGSVHLQRPLTMNVHTFDPGDNSLGESMTIGPLGRLNVQLNGSQDSYGIHNQLDLIGQNGALTSLHFQGADVEMSGTMSVTGNSSTQSRLSVYGDIHLAANANLNLQSSSATPNYLWDTASVTGDGELNIGTGAQLSVHPNATMGVDIDNNGRFEPGIDGTGVVLINGSYVQDPAATMGFDIADVSGADQDWLQATGVAALAGELEVATVGSFVPVPGDVYTVLTAGTRVNTFDALTFDTPDAVSVTAELQYTLTSAFLHILDVSVAGDFNGDLALSCEDVDALVAELASGGMDAQFDLNGDATVDSLDLDQWLQDAGELNVGGGYLYGDANLDGVVDGGDFIVWNGHKFTNTAAWCQGDFNADGVTDGGDFIIWNNNKFTGSDMAMQAVPEPQFGLCGLIGMLILWYRGNAS